MIEDNTVVKSVGEMIKEGSMNPRDIHSEWENNKDALIAQLQEGIVEVTFLKVNGDERVMTCTLREDVKPAATKKDPLTLEKVRKINEEVLSVWDVKAEGWRSFRWGLISSVTESDVVIDVETA
jgi:hypothetical protein